ncbi:hypothetical protein LJR074_002560 [Acidovorax sp. LjRoot74]|uniref:hypothetical protein n=1 Tax=Acidovorax sp. LjRoot74 TaxID=3342337 RepID=UPI003ED16420
MNVARHAMTPSDRKQQFSDFSKATNLSSEEMAALLSPAGLTMSWDDSRRENLMGMQLHKVSNLRLRIQKVPCLSERDEPGIRITLE